MLIDETRLVCGQDRFYLIFNNVHNEIYFHLLTKLQESSQHYGHHSCNQDDGGQDGTGHQQVSGASVVRTVHEHPKLHCVAKHNREHEKLKEHHSVPGHVSVLEKFRLLHVENTIS